MLAKLEQNVSTLSAADAQRATHLLLVLPQVKSLAALPPLPFLDVLGAALRRRRKKVAELSKAPLSADLPQGGLASWVMLDAAQSPFEQQTALRKALQPLLAEKPGEIVVGVFGDAQARRLAAGVAVYAAWVNGMPLPQRKKKPDEKPLQRIRLYGYRAADGFAALRAQAAGNALCRELTVLPPNELTPGAYRERIKQLARDHGWERQEYDLRKLRRMGAGAFVAVAQGSAEDDAAIVHLRYRGKKAKKNIALVGKGICFDTGGHNLKTARYMHGMHEDMNGSAVALGILLAATEAKLPVNLDCWMALAQNHLSPRAYKQNEVVTALNGTTIEIVHTDAEGRMVLADTLHFAARAKPRLIMDYATLTGACVGALSTRMSGAVTNRMEFVPTVIEAGWESGERVWPFPLEKDFDQALKSTIADLKQCTLDGEADQILAASFLRKFIDGDLPWVHVDLSSGNHKGGLAHIPTDITGFGVRFSLNLLLDQKLLA